MRQESRKIIWVIGIAALVTVLIDLFWQFYFRLHSLGVENFGVSFGLGKEWGRVLSLIAYGFFVVWYLWGRYRGDRRTWPILLVALGGLGNLICRLVWGSVWDYICFSWLPFCFNLADLLISVGAISYILGVDGYSSVVRRQRNSGNK
ncbi:MAG TPA: signal peptidase II [Candidatus Woesebacteria bacterium]|nr:signal peptidase II [Candidatus Woesebacteria bacterium]